MIGVQQKSQNIPEHADVLIIGGGAAGMMAAISAKTHHPQSEVVLVDRSYALGRKILVCGAGRCNITNVNLDTEFEHHYYGASPKFLKSVFKQYGFQDIVKFFEELGFELYVERKTEIGKMFPTTNQAESVRDAMEDEMVRLGVKIFKNTEVKKILIKGKKFNCEVAQINRKNELLGKCEIVAGKLIVSAGGKSYPALGSDGSGYSLLDSLGHSVVEPVPSALPVEASDKLIHLLQNQKLPAEVTAIVAGEKIKTTTDDLFFKRYGVSGPSVLNVSREISIAINRAQKGECELEINFFPGKSTEQVREMLTKRWLQKPEQTVISSLVPIFGVKFPKAAMDVADIQIGAKGSELMKTELKRLLELLTSYRLQVTNTRGWNEAEFTAGGVESDEIQPHTLESTKVPNLYLAGEIINVDGDVGGYNLSWAWSSGWIAGKSQ